MDQNINYDSAKKVIESLLFVSKRPISTREIDEVTNFGIETIEEAIDEIGKSYEKSALQVIKLANGYVIATRPEFSGYIEKFLNSPISVTLSPQALETLSIIAYKQPVTRIDVENIRGVMCDGVINTLLDRKLIKESGRSDSVGRPILYSTTIDFLKHFGLHDLSELPRIESEEGPKTALKELETASNEHVIQ